MAVSFEVEVGCRLVSMSFFRTLLRYSIQLHSGKLSYNELL